MKPLTTRRLARAARRRARHIGVGAAVVAIAGTAWFGVGSQASSLAASRTAGSATPTAHATGQASQSRSGAAMQVTKGSTTKLSAPAEKTAPAATPTATPTPAAGTTATPAALADLGAPITDDTQVVTIGDSIMAGYGLSDASTNAWPVLLGQQTGLAVTNDSCSGAGFIAVGDCDTNFDGLLATAEAAHPAVVVIQSSDNDFGEDPTELAAATTHTLASIRAALPDAHIVALSTLWDQPGDVPDQVAQSSADIQQAVTAVGGSYVDIGQPIAGQDDLLQADSEHPTDAGQQVLATTILADLRAAGVPI